MALLIDYQTTAIVKGETDYEYSEENDKGEYVLRKGSLATPRTMYARFDEGKAAGLLEEKYQNVVWLVFNSLTGKLIGNILPVRNWSENIEFGDRMGKSMTAKVYGWKDLV